jgi:outer membrane receptor protein involved in Fe transport
MMSSFGVRLVVTLGMMLGVGAAQGQVAVQLQGHAVDLTGGVLSGVTVEVRQTPGGPVVGQAVTDASGSFSVVLHDGVPGNFVVEGRTSAMDSGVVTVAVAQGGSQVDLVMNPTAVQQSMTVTATRSEVSVGALSNTIAVLSAEQLENYPALTLDEQLRQHAGFELFRRSSGWVQNPTSQGISLRGLGSTAASRTLVLADGAPLNDPFGGWVHWNEIPSGALDAVTIATGGGSDLYGSSALGGVINVLPAKPVDAMVSGSVLGAGEGTVSGDARGDLKVGKWSGLLAGQDFNTQGYILTAPEVRGAVDVPANVHFESGRAEIDHAQTGALGHVFLTGNVLNEARGNGTVVTNNGTRLWRYLGGDDWSAGSKVTGRVRAFGSDEAYRQTFSSVSADRNTESLSRIQHVGTQELGAATDATVQLTNGSKWTSALVFGADVRDIRANDVENPVAVSGPSKGMITGLQETSARQRFVGGFVEGLAQSGPWSGAASVRVDSAQNLDTHTNMQTLPGPVVPGSIPDRGEIVVSPRLGLVRRLGNVVSVRATGFRAFRAPTMNELYRTGQVGSVITLANSGLLSERATGAEGGVVIASPGGRWNAQATYFWTEINRPVSTVLVSSTPTSMTNIRENLGQIQSQGTELGLQWNSGRWISATVGYQYAHAVVTEFSAQPSLVGNWIPDVPRESFTAQVRAQRARWGSVTLAMQSAGQAFDDSANTLVLRKFFQMGLFADRGLGKGFTAFVAFQNLTGERSDVSRTPNLTQGIPFIAQGGVRFIWNRGK